MYIEEIIVDGFKSYAQRTVIAGFDPTFNAITGLNGSGKSNILDAICFVLGITNLSQVRVSNLQELVYKQGQAGVTKASVSIVFNNTNPKQSPVGYESYDRITVNRQVVMGGRNKYLINGHTAMVQRVQNLFLSVQLNVNNPHFLIMQGRITKVINMKPPEILAMIEEAAGTRLFEIKKKDSLKLIAKKSKRVEEIEKILNDEITPTLQNLERERTHYSKFISNQSEIAQLTKFTTAYEYTKTQAMLTDSSTVLEDLENSREEQKQRAQEIRALIDTKNKQIKETASKKDKEMEGGLKEAEKHVEKLAKDLVKLNSELKHAEESLKEQDKGKKSLLDGLKEVKTAIVKKEKECSNIESSNSKFDEKHKQFASELADLQRQYQTLSTGLSSDAEGEKTLNKQLMDAERDTIDAETEIKQSSMKVENINKTLKEKKQAAKSVGKEYVEFQQKVDTLSQSVKSLEDSLKKIDYDEKKEADLLVQRRQEEQIVSRLREEVEQLSSQISDFKYSDPEKGFDRSKVKGLVANLITVEEPKATLALEVVAGGKLFNVIVDNEETGKQLLKNGKLTRRVTILPLNNINKRKAEDKTVKRAQSLAGKGQVNLALSLVGFEDEIENAMNFVFGNAFVCENSAVAKKVTFDELVRTKSVTLQGDVFDPSGTLTGGSRQTSNSPLKHLQKLNEKRKELEEHEEILESIKKQLEKMASSASSYREKKKQFELKSHELELLKERIGQNPHHRLLETVRELEEQLEQAKQSAKDNEEKQKTMKKRCDDLRSQMKNFSSTREDRMKQLEKKIAEVKVKEASSTKEARSKQQEIQQHKLELEDLRNELKSTEEQIEQTEDGGKEMLKEFERIKELSEDKRNELEEAESELEEKKSRMISCDRKMTAIVQEKDNLSKELTDVDIELKKIEHKITHHNEEQTQAAKFVKHLEEKYVWIAKEKQFFGKVNTPYDFKARNAATVQKELNDLTEEQATLSKQVNKKVMSMFEKAEQEYKDLVEKRAIIEKDKEKIEAVISELDGQKNKALEVTWQKVNKDFGSIFSTLLPGTTAKLEIPEGLSVIDGLEMKVAFAGVWKESLSELSGGQRSLLALSLILALLLFKPAPMYILDEIDAALDLSHTQNIGQMLKNHFSQSQFIVVSLKEDMFRNANVLFRTKFVDGVSTVTRTKRTTK